MVFRRRRGRILFWKRRWWCRHLANAYYGTAKWGDAKVFLFFSFFRGIVSRATRDGKGGVATREVRVADENRAATTFLNLNGVARRAVQRGARRARRRCAPDTFGCFFSPGLFGLLFCPSNKTPFVVLLRVSQREMIMHIINTHFYSPFLFIR